MNLDNRLQGIADLVNKSKLVLDVGTDHGYLCIYLVKNQKAERAIAADISKGSLQKAIDLVKEENLEDKIECRLGSGIEVAKLEDDIDTITIAGMGGILISDILETSKDFIRIKKPILILQPVQRPEVLRKYLIENGFNIIFEELVKAEGKIYNIIKCSWGESEIAYNPNYYEIGYLHDKTNKAIYLEQVEFLINKYKNIVASMVNSKSCLEDEVRSKTNYISFLEELLNDETK